MTQLATSKSLYIPGTKSLTVAIHQYDIGDDNEQLMTGTWRFTNDVCKDGDLLVVAPVDHKGIIVT